MFGFGAVDAVAMVTRARTWTNVPEQLSQNIYSSTRSRYHYTALYIMTTLCPHRTARDRSPLCLTFEVSASSIVYLEHVVLTLSLGLHDVGTVYSVTDLPPMSTLNHSTLVSWLTHHHPRRGDIKLDLTSPSGTLSHLLPYRQYDFINQRGYTNWPFMSVQHWGENPIGQWNLSVTFKSSSGFVSVSGVRLKLYGIKETSTQHTSSHPPTQHTSSHPPTQHTATTLTLSTRPPLVYILAGSVGGACILTGLLVAVSIIYCWKRSTQPARLDTMTLL